MSKDLQDGAERHRAEAALAEREAQYRSVLESTSDGLLIFDLEGYIVETPISIVISIKQVCFICTRIIIIPKPLWVYVKHRDVIR